MQKSNQFQVYYSISNHPCYVWYTLIQIWPIAVLLNGLLGCDPLIARSLYLFICLFVRPSIGVTRSIYRFNPIQWCDVRMLQGFRLVIKYSAPKQKLQGSSVHQAQFEDLLAPPFPPAVVGPILKLTFTIPHRRSDFTKKNGNFKQHFRGLSNAKK